MRVTNLRTSNGYKIVAVSGSSDAVAASMCATAARRRWLKSLARKRKAIGKRCAAAESNAARRTRQNNGHGRSRSSTLAFAADAEVAAAIIKAAKARGVAKCALVGMLIEVIIEDDLISAILDRGEINKRVGR